MDWSSDVCSSDHDNRIDGEPGGRGRRVVGGADVDTEAARLRIDAAWVGHAVRHIIEDIAIWRRGIPAGRKRAGNDNCAAKACRPLHLRTSPGSHADPHWIDLPIAGKLASEFRVRPGRSAHEGGRLTH